MARRAARLQRFPNLTTHTYTPSDARAARALCGDDGRAERAPRLRVDQIEGTEATRGPRRPKQRACDHPGSRGERGAPGGRRLQREKKRGHAEARSAPPPLTADSVRSSGVGVGAEMFRVGVGAEKARCSETRTTLSQFKVCKCQYYYRI